MPINEIVAILHMSAKPFTLAVARSSPEEQTPLDRFFGPESSFEHYSINLLFPIGQLRRHEHVAIAFLTLERTRAGYTDLAPSSDHVC
jgi:hypothetical protein